MDNFASNISPQPTLHTGIPLNPSPIPPLAAEPETTSTVEALVATPLEPVFLTATVPSLGETQPDGNVQAHLDVNYQAHDVALVSVQSHPSPPKSALKTSEHHKIPFENESDGHPEKSSSCWAALNKLFLALAILCFALLLCSILYIISNREGFNDRFDGRGPFRLNPNDPIGFDDGLTGSSSENAYFNLTEAHGNGIIVVLSRRGASVSDILLPHLTANGTRVYRSIVLQGGKENHFGAARFGFHDPANAMNMIGQLPPNYPFANYYTENWMMYADVNKPSRVRFVLDLIQVTYELTSADVPELRMTTMIATPSNQRVTADPTNNIYFNLRGYGDLSTHLLNLSQSTPIDIQNRQKVEQDHLIQPKPVDQLTNINNYFYKLDHAGLGKNYVATLSESKTHTTVRIFSDHAGLVVDPFGDGAAQSAVHPVTANRDVRGVRISPRQSPTFETTSIYGPTLIEYPSQAIHSTWWQIQYEN